MHNLQCLSFLDKGVLPHVLFASPNQLHLENLSGVHVVTEEDAIALSTIPTLTKLCITCIWGNHAAFLGRLPRLTCLEIRDVYDEAGITHVMECIQKCAELTELHLGNILFSGAHLAILLSQLPKLKVLSRWGCKKETSLSCLQVGNLPATLTELYIGPCNVKLSLQKMHVLRKLRVLQFSAETFNKMDQRVAEWFESVSQSPSFLFPALENVITTHLRANHNGKLKLESPRHGGPFALPFVFEQPMLNTTIKHDMKAL